MPALGRSHPGRPVPIEHDDSQGIIRQAHALPIDPDPGAGDFIQAVQPVQAAGPDGAVGIMGKPGAGAQTGRGGGILDETLGFGIEAGDPAGHGGQPQAARPIHMQVVHEILRKTARILRIVAEEADALPLDPGKPALGGCPDEAGTILGQIGHHGVGQPILRPDAAEDRGCQRSPVGTCPFRPCPFPHWPVRQG